MFTNLNTINMEVCCKTFRRDVLEGILLKRNRFGFEPEMTVKFAAFRTGSPRRPAAPSLPGLRYTSIVRWVTFGEGKKSGLKDGLQGLYCILSHCILKRCPPSGSNGRASGKSGVLPLN